MIKKHRWIVILALLLTVFTSCNNEPEHSCSYDSVTLACSCGSIKDGVVAYIGSSYENATARFLTLQSAADYVENHPKTKAVLPTKVYGRPGVQITCDGLSIRNSSIEFCLESNEVIFTENAIISIYNSDASIGIGTVNASSIPISVDSSSLDIDASFSCEIDMKGDSNLSLSGDSVTINGFTADDESTINLESNNITVADTNTASNIWKNLSSEDANKIKVPAHSHDYDNDKLECECGRINPDLTIVAYIGSSYESADARFISVQKALDYVKTKQATSGKTTATTVNVRSGVTVSDSSITIADSNVALSTAQSLTLGVTMTSTSTLELKSGSLKINSFSADDNSKVKLNGGSLTLSSTTVAKGFWDNISVADGANVTVTGHSHTYDNKDDGTYCWQECSVCGYCTEKKKISNKWVSMFYLDIANLSALEDIDEIIEYTGVPTNVTVYIITGGGDDQGVYNKEYYNPFYKEWGSYVYPNLVQALKNAGYKSGSVDFNESRQKNHYQYWKYYLGENGKGCFKEIEYVEPKLMSDGYVMKKFINFVYSLEQDESKRYLLHLWNHGGGNMWGMMQDLTDSSWPLMSMDDFDTSVNNSTFVKDGNKFDIILFDMCEMQQIETANMIKKYAKCMVGSENTTYASALGRLYEYINKYPQATIKDIVTYFIDKTYDKQCSFTSGKAHCTWSALDLDSSKLSNFNSAFENFLNYFVKTSSSNIEDSLEDSVDYYSSSSHDTCSYDIYDVALQSGYGGLSALKSALDDVVIYERHGSPLDGTTGLAFFLDINLSSHLKRYGTNYDYYIARAKENGYPSLVTLTNMYK